MSTSFRLTPLVALRIAILVALGCALVWHLLPHVVWAWHLEPSLAAMPRADRLHVQLVTRFEEPPASWPELEHRGVRLRVPLDPPHSGRCAFRDGECHRELVGGRVSVHSSAPSEDFWEMVNLRAPDRDDLSLLRSARANWETIDALRLRVTTARAKLRSWRYVAPHSRGVVAESERGAVVRYVIAAYDPSGRDARIVGLAGLDRRAVLQVVGSIRFDAAAPGRRTIAH